MNTTIELRGMHFFAFHGYYEEERKMGNWFILHVAMEVNTFDEIDDNINDTINYEDIYTISKEVMEESEKLLEKVIMKLISKYKSTFPQVLKGSVSLEKISPQLGGKVDKAIISMKF